MRSRIIAALIGLVGLSAPCRAASEADLDTLRSDWHRCVREAFSAQPARLEKRAAERAALSECKSGEDAYVAAELAARQAEVEARRKGSLATRARSWMSAVAAYVVDPVTGFFDGLKR